MADKQFKFDIVMNAQNVINGASALAAQFNKLSTNSNTSSKRLRETATAMEAASRAAKNERASLIAVAEAQEQINRKNRESKAAVGLTGARTDEVASRAAANTAVAAGREQLYLSKAQTEEVRQRTMIENQTGVSRSRELRDQLAIQREQERQARALANAENARFDHLSSTRYAMYDVSNAARNVGLTMIALAGASAAVAIEWEKDFAQVRRTVGGSGAELAKLHDEFISMAQDMPATWDEITEVGTLAGQLGIARKNVADFTETTIKFSATTDVAVGDAATSFGRLDNILLNNSGQYENLASSVLKVGVNSVATESQILKITTQIASTAKQAGFTAEEVIGLSGALASLGVPPELSRGVTTRVFGEMSRAISEGGIKMEQFGSIAGMSGKQFKEAWQADAGAAFQAFLAGINKQGAGAESSLRALGITSVRDVPILLRLANSGTVVKDAFADAASGFAENTELTKQYGVIADTTAARLQRLVNSFQALVSEGASGSLGILSAALDDLLNRLKNVTEVMQTPGGQVFAGAVLAITALIGVLGLLVAAGTTAVAGYIALIQVMRQAQTLAGTNVLSFSALNATLAATGPAGAKAATALRIVGGAMKALAAATIILAIPDLANGLQGWSEDLKGTDRSFEAAVKRMTEYGKTVKTVQTTVQGAGMYGTNMVKDVQKTVKDMDNAWQKFDALSDFEQDWQRVMANANLNAPGPIDDIKRIDDALSDLAENDDWTGVISGLNTASKGAGLSMNDMLRALNDTDGALKAAGYSVEMNSKGLYVLKSATDGAVVATQQLSEAEEEADQARVASLEAWATADQTFLDIKGTYDSMIEKQKDLAQQTADDTPDMADSWQTYFDGVSVNIDDYLTNLQKMIDSQNNWESNMFALRERGASDEMIEQLRSLGVEGAPLVQEFVNGTDEEIQRFNEILGAGGAEGAAAFATGIADATPELLQRARALGQDTYDKVVEGLKNGTLSAEDALSQIIEPLENTPVEVTIEGNAAPALEDFDNAQAYAEAMQIWLNARGAHTKPARDQFDSDQAYAEALRIYYTANANTKPAREEFRSAQDYANGLRAWIQANADTWQAEQDLARLASKQRYAYIQAQLVNPDGGRPINAGQFGGATGGYFGPKGFEGFAYGGYTGDGHKYQPKGIVHGGEFVFDQVSTGALGRTFLSSLMASAKRGYAGGGMVNSSAGYQSSYASRQSAAFAGRNVGPTLVELSARDRQLLARIPEGLSINIGNEKVSRAANAANLNAGSRGTN